MSTNRSSRLAQAQALLLVVLLLSLFQSSCSDGDLKKVSKALVVTAEVVGQVQTDVIAANAQKLISDDTTRSILEACNRISLAGKEATAVTRNLTKLDISTKSQVLEILKPVLLALDNAITKDIIVIADQSTRDNVRLSLVSIQSALNSIQIIVAGGS
jgi:hypothetical protein